MVRTLNLIAIFMRSSVFTLLLSCLFLFVNGCAHFSKSGVGDVGENRQVLSLDGTWEIAEGGMDVIPGTFERKVPVPGLVTLSEPPFEQAGPTVPDRTKVPQKDPRRDAFWYRRSFNFNGPVPEVAMIKVAKAMFGSRVYLNGQLIGDHAPSFTPGYFDVRQALRAGENVVHIRVGADRDAVTLALPSGFDVEKERYIPGIFDSVALITSGTPHIVNVQVAPDITNSLILVQTELRNVGATVGAQVTFTVREAKSGRTISTTTNNLAKFAAGTGETVLVKVPVPDARLWSPEDPFLYTLKVDTGADTFQTRFGMRHFRFDPETRKAVLNGKPYFMRGSNITLYRFFEDPECGDLPWNEDWVRNLHLRVKDMNWNCLRYCIGFPPEAWYDIADELGILIQDEFPIWYGPTRRQRWPAELKSPQLALEYRQWMRERWNHPSVVIWDATNETTSEEPVLASRQVRGLDLSGRPWDNSYMYPDDPGDTYESHPYHFINPQFKLSQLEDVSRIPQGNVTSNDQKHAVIINEYGWLWLNRDGTPTTLTSNLYRNLLGPNSTTAQRRHLYARYLAAETEFWRAYRNAAAIMHFTALGYSRPDGQTSDHWMDVKKLEWEPEFYKYVKDSFEPVGLMIEFWKERMPGGVEQRVPVMIINDLETSWVGDVTLRLTSAGKVVKELKQAARVEPFGTGRVFFSLDLSAEPADYKLEAHIRGAGERTVRSLRDFSIIERSALGLAFRKPAKASSVLREGFAPFRAFDYDFGSYWSSEAADPAWLAVDLGKPQEIGRVEIHWENAFAKVFAVETSVDGENWTEAYKADNFKGGVSKVNLNGTTARWVRMHGYERGTQWGYAIREFLVFPAEAKLN
jgi:beta-galactosidase